MLLFLPIMPTLCYPNRITGQENNYSNYLTTVRTPVCCRSVRLPTSPDYAQNVPIMLESVPITLALCLIFPRPYYARHYAGIICPSLLPSLITVYGQWVWSLGVGREWWI